MHKRFGRSTAHRVRALTERLRLLVIGDDVASGHALASDLRRLGYASRIASNVKACIQVLGETACDLAIVDAHGVHDDYPRLRAALRAQRLPVLWLLEADAHHIRTADPWLDRCDVCLRKPIGLMDLERSLKQLSRQRYRGL